MRKKLYHGDCLEILKKIPDNKIDTCITDPPYELGFMNKDWDSAGISFQKETWEAVYRVLKPGALLLAFGGTRTWHRIAVAIEDAGFEIRDTICWLYGQGFPKSYNIGKGIDKKAGAEREVVGEYIHPGLLEGTRSGKIWDTALERPIDNNVYGKDNRNLRDRHKITAPATADAELWEGWGTALKPANEPVLVCSKPLTVKLLFGTMIEDITNILEALLSCQTSNVNDAEKGFSAIRAKLKRERVHTVHENAKINVWVNTENVKYVVKTFTSKEQDLIDQKETQQDSAHTDVKGSGKKKTTTWKTIHHGKVEDILTMLQDISISVVEEHTLESIVLSWKNISIDILNQTSMFTIKTGIKLITELKTLRSFLLQTILDDTGNLYPEFMPIIIAMKPIDETYVNNALTHGVAGMWIDGGRIYRDPEDKSGWSQTGSKESENLAMSGKNYAREPKPDASGRWPSNVILDETSAEMLDEQTGIQKGGFVRNRTDGARPFENDGKDTGYETVAEISEPDGGASRFFYVAKASKKERNAGLDDLPDKQKYAKDGSSQSHEIFTSESANDEAWAKKNPNLPTKNSHPTVKPLALMEYLCKLTKTPTGGIVLDPFMGSGTTGMACVNTDRDFIGIELVEEHYIIARKRIEHAKEILSKD